MLSGVQEALTGTQFVDGSDTCEGAYSVAIHTVPQTGKACVSILGSGNVK